MGLSWRAIADLCAQGYSHEEIAQAMECEVAEVRRLRDVTRRCPTCGVLVQEWPCRLCWCRSQPAAVIVEESLLSDDLKICLTGEELERYLVFRARHEEKERNKRPPPFKPMSYIPRLFSSDLFPEE